MPVYLVRQHGRLWQVWLGDQLLDGQSSYVDALNAAEALAYAAVQRGEPSRILIGSFESVAVEFPILPPPRGPAAGPA
jgi:hypothetical protein